MSSEHSVHKSWDQIFLRNGGFCASLTRSNELLTVLSMSKVPTQLLDSVWSRSRTVEASERVARERAGNGF